MGQALIMNVGRALALRNTAAELMRVDIDTRLLGASEPSGVTRFVLVGDDRRNLGNGGPIIAGDRADSVSVWSTGPRGVSVLFLPRDLRVAVPDHGEAKLGGVLDYGPTMLVRAVQQITGLSIQHYVSLDFAAFTRVIDEVGGIDVTLPKAIRDLVDGLILPAGTHHLDGAKALEYVRARHTILFDHGTWVAADQGDLARILRQQQVIAALLRALHRHSNLWLIEQMANGIQGIEVDPRFDANALTKLFSTLGAASPTWVACTLPSRWQVTARDDISPYPPSHSGSLDYRLQVAGDASLLAWVRAADTSRPPPPGCIAPPSGVAGTLRGH
jgi:LCP family protein required for cell wall assembly